jgi:hypothetical protein
MRKAQAQQEQRGGTGTPGSVGTSGGGLSDDVAPPSSDFATYDVENLFSVSVPANWRQLPGDTSVTFAPEGAFGSVQDSSVFSHGIEIGVAPTESEDLRAATEELVQVFTQSNPQLRRTGGTQAVRFAGRQGLQLRLRNASEVTGSQEMVVLTAALMGNGNMIYSLGVAPQQEFSRYSSTLQRVNESVQLK